jgi:hypothetical protein
MDRESLRPLVDAQYGESRITVLSEETINAELDAELEGITDDSHFDEACCKRIAQRLLRMNGNVAKEAGTQINDWKKKHPVQHQQQQQQQQQQSQEDDDDPKMKAMRDEIDALKKSLKEKDEKAANDAVIAQVRSKLVATFKEGKITPNTYFVNQVIAKIQLPKLEDGQQHDIAKLAKDAEESYYQELKDAGIKFDKPRKGGQQQQDGPDEEALAKREAFKKRMQARGKLPKPAEDK